MYSDLQTTTGKYGSIRSKNLTIYNLTTKDNGYYRCSFNNTDWMLGNDQLLKVTGSYFVSHQIRQIRIETNNDQFDCGINFMNININSC